MMRKNARGVAACLSSLVLLAAIAAPSFAQTQAKSLEEQLVGHWRLVSNSVGDAQPYGVHPQGSMFLDAGGDYSIIVVSDGGARSISYFGAYTLDAADSTMTMHIDASSRAGAAGRDEKRVVAVSGDELTVENRQPARSLGSIKMTWRRAN